jgi:hypothetical protein
VPVETFIPSLYKNSLVVVLTHVIRRSEPFPVVIISWHEAPGQLLQIVGFVRPAVIGLFGKSGLSCITNPGEAPPQEWLLSIKAWILDIDVPTVFQEANTLALKPVYPVVEKEFVVK